MSDPIEGHGPVPAEYGWVSDACVLCGRRHVERGCGLVLPAAAAIGERNIELVYRCACGHDWVSSYELDFARSYALDTMDAVQRGAPHFPRRAASEGGRDVAP